MGDCVRTSRGTVLLSEAARRNQKLLDSFKIGHEKCQLRTESAGQFSRPRSSEVTNKRRKAMRPASLYDFRTHNNIDSWETAKTTEFNEPIHNKMLGRFEFLESRNACIEPVGHCNEAKETITGRAKDTSCVASFTNNSCSRCTIAKGRVEKSEFESNSRPESRYRDAGSSRKSIEAPWNSEQMKEKGNDLHRNFRKIAFPDFTQNPCSRSIVVNSRAVEQPERAEQLGLEPNMGSENVDGLSTEQLNYKDLEPEKMNDLQASQYLDLGTQPLVCAVDGVYSDTQRREKHADEFKKLKIERSKTSEDEWLTVDSAQDGETLQLEIRKESEEELIKDHVIGLRAINVGQSFQNSKKSETTNEECEGDYKKVACCDEANIAKYWDKNLGLLTFVYYDGRSELNGDNNDCLCHMEKQLNGRNFDGMGQNGKMGTVRQKFHEEETCLCLKSRNGLEKEKINMVLQEAKKVGNAVTLCSLNEIELSIHEKDDNIKALKKEEPTGISGIRCTKECNTGAIETDAKMAPTHSANCSIYVIMNQSKRSVYCPTSESVTLSPPLRSQSRALLIHDPADVGADISMEREDLIGSLETNTTDSSTVILSELECSKESIAPEGLHAAKLKASRAIDEILLKTGSIWACTKDNSCKDVRIIILNVNDNKELRIAGKNGCVNEKEISAILKDEGNYALSSADFGACTKAPKLPEVTEAAEHSVADSTETVDEKASRSSVVMKSQTSTERNISRHEFADQVLSIQDKSASGTASIANANQNKVPVAEKESYFDIARPKSPTDANRATKGASGILNPSLSSDQDEASNEEEVMPMSDARIFLEGRPSTVLSPHCQHIYERESNRDLPPEGKCHSEEAMEKRSLSQSAKINSENANIDCKNFEQCRDTGRSSERTKTEQTVLEKSIETRSIDKGNEKQDICSSFDARFARLCWKIERYSLSSLKSKMKGRECPFSSWASLDPNNSAENDRKQCLLSEKRSKSLSSSNGNDSPTFLNVESEASAKSGMARNSDIRPKDDENVHVEENLIFNDDIDQRCKEDGNLENKSADKSFIESQKKCFEASESNLEDEKREAMIANSKEGIEASVEALSEDSNDGYCTYGSERRLSTQLNAKNEMGKEKWQTKISREETTKISCTELPEEYKRRLKKSKCFETLCGDGQGSENRVDVIRHTENEIVVSAAYSVYDTEGEVQERERTENCRRVFSDNKHEKDERQSDRNEIAYGGESLKSNRRRSRRLDYSNEDGINDENESSRRTLHSDKNKEAECNEKEKVEAFSGFHRRLLSRSTCIGVGSGNEEKQTSKQVTYEVKYKNTENGKDELNRKESPEESRKRFRRSKRDEINVTNDSKQHGRTGSYKDDVRNGKQNELDSIKDERSDASYSKQFYGLTSFGKCSMLRAEKGNETSTEVNENERDCRHESNHCMELPESKRRRFGRLKIIERKMKDEQKVATKFHQSQIDELDDQCMLKESSNEKRSLYSRYRRSRYLKQCLEDSTRRDFEGDSILSANNDIESSELDSFAKKKEGCALNFENNILYESEESDAVKYHKTLNGKKFEVSSTKDEEAWHSKEIARLPYLETCAINGEQRKVERKWNTRDSQTVLAIEYGLNINELKGKASTKSERTSKHCETNSDYSAEKIEVEISNEAHCEVVESNDMLSRDVDKMEEVCVRRQRRLGYFLAGSENDQKTSSKDSIEENQLIEGTEGVPFCSKNIQEDPPVPHRESCNLDTSCGSGEKKVNNEAFNVDLKAAVGKSDYKQCSSKREEETFEGLYEANLRKKTENNEAIGCDAYKLIHVDKSQEINSESDRIVKENSDFQGMKNIGSQLKKEIAKSDFTRPEFGNELDNVCDEREKLADSNLIADGCLPASKIIETFENLRGDAEKCKQKHEQEMLVATDKNISTLRVNENTMAIKTEIADKELERFTEEDYYHGYYINNTEDPMDENLRQGAAMLKDCKLKSNYKTEDVNQMQIDHAVDINSYESKMRKIKQKMQQLVHRNTEMEERIECGAREADMCEDKQWKYFLKKQKLLQLAVRKLWQKEGFDSSRLIQDKEYNVYLTEYDLHRKR